jgi:Xaa-Pro aminopeptidase
MIESRIANIRAAMAEKALDGLLVLIEENRRYLSGFTGEDHGFDESAGALLITPTALILATDSRFELQARKEAPLYEAVIYRNGLGPELVSLVERLKIRQLGFESARVSVQQHAAFQKALHDGRRSVTLVPVEDLVERYRQVKTAEEIAHTRKALALAEAAFRTVVRMLRPGMTERSAAWALEKAMREAGAECLSFPVIVAGGPNSALPHAIASDRPIRSGEPILFDWGAKLNGYCSDTSRTVVLGAPDETFKKVHGTVREAQQKAIAAVKAGASSRAVDAVARDFIHQSGYEGRFGHGLGHGTGLAVHEAPRLSPLKETLLETGMIVTVEPGIYLPQWGGVRIENQVVVGDNGPVVLNALPTDYAIDRITG